MLSEARGKLEVRRKQNLTDQYGHMTADELVKYMAAHSEQRSEVEKYLGMTSRTFRASFCDAVAEYETKLLTK